MTKLQFYSPMRHISCSTVELDVIQLSRTQPYLSLTSPPASQHIPVHCGQGQGPRSKVLSEHMTEYPFAFTRLAVGAPENSTQKDHKPQRQK